MAFMGILLFCIIFVLEKLTVISAGIFLVAGLMLFKAHTIIAIILFVLSGFNLLVFTGWKIYSLKGKTTVRTPKYIIDVKSSVCKNFRKYCDENNYEEMDKLLEKYPHMIYYQVYAHYGLLDYSMFRLNTEMMQCAVNHGAVFDDPFIYSKSLCDFFHHAENLKYITAGVTTDKMIDTVRFALEHGAKVTNENWNFYEQTEKWVQKDGVISPEDEELLNLIKKYS